jgi:tetratricopeptide (TPR) repeat protein
MSQQRIPTLSLLLPIVAMFVTPCVLPAQTSSIASNEPADPPASLTASNAPVSNSAMASRNDDLSLASIKPSKVTTAIQLEFSLEALNGVLVQYRQVGNRQAEAHTLGAIASSYNALHQQQKAIEVFNSELAIWRVLGDKENEGTALAHIGDVYREWGFPDQAAHFYRDALKAYSSTDDKSEEAAVLNNLGLTYFALHDKKKCLAYLNQSLASYRARQDRQGEARALTNLGSTYGFLVNDPHKALDYFQEAVTKLELINDRSTEANALELMGGIWLKLQKQDMAVDSFQRALFLYGRVGDSHGEASVRKQLKAAGDPQLRQRPLS